MRRFVLGGMVAMSVCVATPQSMLAGEFWGKCKRIFSLNLDWPSPYIQQDRASVSAHFAAMTENGWRTQNLLCEYHFTPNGEKLTPAGEIRLKWILTQAPAQHRLVYLQKAGDPQETLARVEAVQKYAQLVQNAPASLVETDMETRGRPAEQVDVISRSALDSMPAPVLPAGSKGGTTAGSTNAGSISSGGGSAGR